MDKSHLLLPTRDTAFPTCLYFLDTETVLTSVGHKTKVHSLRMGVIQKYNRLGEYDLHYAGGCVFKTKGEFNRWLMPKLKDNSKVYIIAHNVVYDATILDLFRVLPKFGFSMRSIYSKGQTSIIRWQRDRCSLIMLDNGNIFSGSIEHWGEVFGLPKLKIDFDKCTQGELEIYCRRDVEIMVTAWRSWLKFLYEHDCGGFRETVASTAFNTWRHKYLSEAVYVHKDPDVLKMERDAYHGGRVEAFYQGRAEGDNYYYLDINNMYGHVMLNSPVPTGLQGYSIRLGLSRMIRKLEKYAVIACVTVNVDKPAFITRVNGYTCYPVGRFETTLTTNELRLALENGWIESVHSFAWYDQSVLFSDYVRKFYDLRMQYRSEGNTGYEAICKMLINSLYGKFGQTGIKQRTIGSCAPDEIWRQDCVNAQSHGQYSQTALGGIVYEETKEGESYHSMPSIAAHITANARLYLFEMMQKAGLENVFYCDTDSLIVNTLGYYNLEHLIEPGALGKLKVEIRSPWLIVNAPKDYEMLDRRKIKGIRSNAIELEPGVFLQEQWVKLAGLIRQGFAEGYTSKEIVKHQQRVIHSGIVMTSGRVEPFHL